MWLFLLAATQQHDQELGHLQMEALYAILCIESTQACIGNTASKEMYVALSGLVLGAASTCAGPPVSTLQHCMACISVIAGWRNFPKSQITGQAQHSWAMLTKIATLLEVIACTYLSSLYSYACMHQQSAGSLICTQPCLSPSDMYIPVEFMHKLKCTMPLSPTLQDSQNQTRCLIAASRCLEEMMSSEQHLLCGPVSACTTPCT